MVTVKRNAPAGGYDFPSKRHYRRNLYRFIKDEMGPRRQAVQFLILPSIEGHEIETAMQYGFYERNLHVVDRNAAIVATLKRRYRELHTYGVSLGDASKRISKAGTLIAFANLDLCGHATGQTLKELTSFQQSEAVQYGFVAVTVLRGRENNFDLVRQSADYFQAGQQISDECGDLSREFHSSCELIPYVPIRESLKSERLTDIDFGRVQLIKNTLMGLPDAILGKPFHNLKWNRVYLARSGKYRSIAGTQSMLWMLFCIHKQPCLCDQCQLDEIAMMLNSAAAKKDLVCAQRIRELHHMERNKRTKIMGALLGEIYEMDYASILNACVERVRLTYGQAPTIG